MATRPPTSAGGGRPKTSAGRPPTAAKQQQPAASPAPGPLQRQPTSQGRPRTSMASRAPSSMSTAAGQFFNQFENGQAAAQSPAPIGPVRPGSRARVASRIGSAMGNAAVSNRPDRPSSRVGTAMGQRPLNVAARPVTQQGLTGVRAPSRSAVVGTAAFQNRQVLDKSYYMGLIRSKITELTTEIGNLTRDIERNEEQRQNAVVYEKTAEELAMELKEFQGNLADYNTLIDKMNTNTDMDELQQQVLQLKEQNDSDAGNLDELFAERRRKEETARQLEAELNAEKRETDNFLNNMPPAVRDEYTEAKSRNEQLAEELQLKSQELEQLTGRLADMEQELAVSQLKQQAMTLHEKMAELERRKEGVVAEINAEGTPEQQKERLMEKLKRSNEEIQSMEKQTQECQERIGQIFEEMKELDEEFEDQQGEKNQKYRELRQKEQQIDEFLGSYEPSREEEQARIDRFQRNIVRLLSVTGRNVAESDKTAMVTGMEDYDLSAVGPNRNADTLQQELAQISGPAQLQELHVQLQEEMIKVEEMEGKANEEAENLKLRMGEMQDEMAQFGDVNSLTLKAEQKREALLREKTELEATSASLMEKLSQMQQQKQKLDEQLNGNDNHLQIVNLESKLIHLEENKFALRDALLSRKAETDVEPVKEQCLQMVAEYNQILCQMAAVRTGSAVNRNATLPNN